MLPCAISTVWVLWECTAADQNGNQLLSKPISFTMLAATDCNIYKGEEEAAEEIRDTIVFLTGCSDPIIEVHFKEIHQHRFTATPGDDHES